MRNRVYKSLCLAVVVLGLGVSSAKAQITYLGENFGFNFANVQDFEGVALGNYNTTISVANMTFGERFSPQTVTTAGNSDVLVGLPTVGSSLSLLTGAATENLLVETLGTRVLSGVGATNNSNGRGAITILFNTPVSQFGFGAVNNGGGGGGGGFLIRFFQGDGTNMQVNGSVSLSANSAGGKTHSFQRTGGVADIRGITIETFGGGLSLDNVQFGTGIIPEPAPLALALPVLGLVGVSRRWRRTRHASGSNASERG